MPKELHEITKFTSGTITVPDVKDIPEDAASYSLNLDSVTASGKLQGTPGDLKLAAGGAFSATAGQPEITQVECVADVSNNLDEKYFDIYTAAGKTLIWFDVPGGSSVPTGSGSYADTIEVTGVNTNYTAIKVSIALASAINADAGGHSTAESVGGQVFITDAANAARTDSAEGDTGFTISTSQQGASGTSPLTVDADVAVMINKGGQRDVIYYENDTNKIHNIVDLYTGNAGFAQNDMGTIVSGDDEVVMQVHNKEVHIGAGKGSTDVPKWVGYVDHKQFGTAVTALQKEDAELKRPGTFPPIYKIIRVGGVNFGIQYGGSRIYKFTDTAFDSASYTQFVSTQGICLRSAGTDIFVYDDNTAFGTLYKIDVSEWGTEDEISQESSIDGWHATGTSLDSGFDISDIHDDGSYVWFHAYKSGTITSSSKWLYNAATPTANGSLTPTNRTPRLAAGTDNGTPVNAITAVLYKQCLVKGSSWSGVGVCLYLNHTGDFYINYSISSISTFTDGIAIISVEPTYIAGAAYSITVGGTGDAQIHEVITNGTPAFSATNQFGGDDHMGGFYQDGTRFFAALRASTTDTEILVMEDADQATMTASSASTHFEPLVHLERSDDDVDPIEADGLCMTYDTDQDVLYMCENGSGGGYTDVNYDGTSTFSDIDYLERPDLRVTFADGGAGDFKDDETYFWKFAYVYDEYQESPLSFHFAHTPSDDKDVQLTIDLYNLSGLPKRVSHLAVYRAQNDNAAGQASPETFYRLVKKIKFDKQSFSLISSGWGGTDYRSQVLLDKLTDIGSSYEARTLMPETLETSMVNYALSTQINSMHIVGKCYKTEISDPMNYLFKSKVNNFNQFDWTTDFLRLPTVPTALASFNGRIFAFDENNTYRINPQGFYIEDVFNGAGCFGPQSVVVTEYGMCYCDKNNIYLHDGKVPKPIATPILTGDAYYSWHNIVVATLTPAVMFEAKRKSFIIFFMPDTGTHRMAWAYNIIFNRWDMFRAGNNYNPKAFLHGKNGELYVSKNNQLHWYLGSTSTTLDFWEWQSKYMTMGEDTVKKKFYDVKVIDGGTAPTITYGVDGDTTPEDTLSSGKIQSTHSKSKSLQIFLEQSAGATHTVDSVGILYRRLPKTSGNI